MLSHSKRPLRRKISHPPSPHMPPSPDVRTIGPIAPMRLMYLLTTVDRPLIPVQIVIYDAFDSFTMYEPCTEETRRASIRTSSVMSVLHYQNQKFHSYLQPLICWTRSPGQLTPEASLPRICSPRASSDDVLFCPTLLWYASRTGTKGLYSQLYGKEYPPGRDRRGHCER